MNKVLVIAPHMDDEALGCGGTIAKHKGKGDIVSVIFVAHRVYNHLYDEHKNNIEKSCALKAKGVLKYDEVSFLDLPDERIDGCIQDVILPLEKYIEELKPEIVYIPFRGDNNQDHRAVFDAARIVLRPSGAPFINKIFMYEVPSSTEQSPPLLENTFLPNYYVNIKEYIDIKIQAFGCYETEKRDYPHPRSRKALRILSQKRGTEVGFEFAETFMILRKKWN